MLCAAWPYVNGDLVSARRRAAKFLDDLKEDFWTIGNQNWVEAWTNIGDAHCLCADLNIEMGAFDEAIQAWLCALTAFEVARRLCDEGPRSRDISAKVESTIQEFGSALEKKVERVQIACGEPDELLAYYLPAIGSDLCTPAVVCISSEQETGAVLLARLLPVVIDRGMSVLVVSHEDVSQGRGQSEVLLSCCLDYLSDRPDVDATRIGVYGEGLSAVLATDFAVSDRRAAAAVCDGGLWSWGRTLASVRWMTRTADVVDEDIVSACRSRLLRQLRCPVLVVAGGRGTVSASEAIKLKAEGAAARIDLELVMPHTTRTSLGEIENFVTSDDCIFGWLERKLVHRLAR